MGSIVGRDSELASIREFLERVRDAPGALVLEGEAGVGKTTLWEAGVDGARERDIRVLEARPAESETALSFSAIGDLLEPVLDETLESLPVPQRRALSRALLLDDEGPPPDPHAIGVAVLTALRTLADREPLVVAVDDVQWLDPASVGALSYTARRLCPERAGVMLARRTPSESGLVSELRRCLSPAQLTIVDVAPLDPTGLHRVVQEHLGTVLPRPVLVEVHAASGGNPFYALEIVRALQRSATLVEAGQPLPVPDSLRDLVHGRLAALPQESRDFLLAATAHAQPTVAVTEAASGVATREGLTPALEAGVVELDGERIRFTHPLLATGAYEMADPDRRREIHTRLAELVDDAEARAWQLAASTSQADEGVSRVLEDAAGHARARGAPRSAALLLERARELTPDSLEGDAVRRATDAAFLHFEAGDSRRAESLLRDVIAPLPAGPVRARALVVLARVRLYEAPDEANRLFAQVVEEAEDDPPTLALAHEGAAACCIWTFRRFDEAVRHTDVALALADELEDDALVADVLMDRLTAETMLGRSAAAATAERALALQDSTTEIRVLDQPLLALAEYWKWVDAHERARDALVYLLQRAHDLGDENARPWLLFLLGDVERLLGNLEVAAGLARDGQESAQQSGQQLFRGLNLALESLVRAELGDVEGTRKTARLAAVAGSTFVDLVSSAAVGQLELASGASERAAAELEAAVAFAQKEEIVEPTATRFVVDQVEALVELGRRDEATELLDWYEGNARRLDRASAIASCLRCRGLLASQAGDVEEALAAYAEALEWHGRAELPLDRGRTLIALGAAQRRAKRRREARVTLESAAEVFERIGAALWAKRAYAELERISGRAPTTGALTPAEERVAELVAAGRTNQEVADALFLSKRTVDGHVSRILGKLGISHRAELTHALASSQTQVPDASNTGTTSVSAGPPAP